MQLQGEDPHALPGNGYRHRNPLSNVHDMTITLRLSMDVDAKEGMSSGQRHKRPKRIPKHSITHSYTAGGP